MKLLEACKIGYYNNLHTTGECLINITSHYTMFFEYGNIPYEIEELYNEYNKVGNIPISEYFAKQGDNKNV